MNAPIEERRGQCYACCLATIVPEIATTPMLKACVKDMSSTWLLSECEPVLVQGWPVLSAGPYKGRRYGHAWIELPLLGLVWDHLRNQWIQRDVFYQAGELSDEFLTRYDRDEALVMVELHEHAGPWDEGPDGHVELPPPDPENQP